MLRLFYVYCLSSVKKPQQQILLLFSLVCLSFVSPPPGDTTPTNPVDAANTLLMNPTDLQTSPTSCESIFHPFSRPNDRTKQLLFQTFVEVSLFAETIQTIAVGISTLGYPFPFMKCMTAYTTTNTSRPVAVVVKQPGTTHKTYDNRIGATTPLTTSHSCGWIPSQKKKK